MRVFRILCAIYGTSAIATFIWLFLRLSGASACTAGWQSCESVAGSAGMLALAWPSYWGSIALGEPLATRSTSLLGTVILLLGFAAMTVFALAWKQFQRRKPD